MFQRIVVPLDGSTLAEQALPIAAHIARASGASLILLRVLITLADSDWRPTRGIPFDRRVITDEERAEAAAYLTQIEERTDLEGLGIVTVVAEGNAAEHILSLAQDQQADLIIMTSHGYTGFKRWVLGSVAEKVARHSTVPVLILRDTATLSTSLQTGDHTLRVMAAVDGSTLAEAALPFAVSLAGALAHPARATLNLVRVLPLTYSEAKIAVQSDNAAVKAKEYLASLEQRISRYEEAVQLAAITATVTLDVDVAGALIDLAEQGEEGRVLEAGEKFGGCDVMVLATHGRGGFQRRILGSVTERVLHRTNLALLIVRPQEIRVKQRKTLEEKNADEASTRDETAFPSWVGLL
jgi:nucleotide-binding universal stress UspA family protein